MRIPGLGRAFSFCRSVRNRFSPPAFILAYHRIADVTTDPHLLTVSPSHFAEQLAILKRTAPIVSLDRLVSDLSERGSVRNMIVVTFDDGYLDNLKVAKPLLERFDSPATVYVTTSFCEGAKFWWEELTQLLLYPGILPKTITLRLDAGQHSWSTGDTHEYSSDEFAHHRHWDFTQPETPSLRHKLFRDLCEVLTSLPHTSREGVMAQLRSMHRHREEQPDNLPKGMSPAELTELGLNGLITIGAHTVNHNKLPLMPPAILANEIGESKRWLEEVLCHPVSQFAYPHGAWSAGITEAVRAAKFSSAVTCEERVVDRSANLFELPRFTVRDWDGNQFEQKLRAWLN